MGEVQDWWSSLPGRKKLGYGLFSTLGILTISLHLYNQRKFLYDPKKKKVTISKWDQ